MSPAASMGDGVPKVTGRRVVAALIDLVPLSVLFLGMASQFGELQTSGGFNVRLYNIPFLLYLAAFAGYFVFAEAASGTTLGKWVMGLEVSKLDSSRLTWGAIIVRNTVRLLDLLPAFYLVGIVAVWSTRNNQRLGDLAASTVVLPRGRLAYATSASSIPLGDAQGASLDDDDIPAQQPRRASRAAQLLIALGVAAIAASVGVTLLTLEPPSRSLGGLSIEGEVNTFVEEAMGSVFGTLSPDELAARSAPELAELPGFAPSFQALAEYPGPLVGAYRIVDVALNEWKSGPSAPALPLAEFRIEGEFRDGPTTLLLAVVNRNGTLQIVGWRVIFG